MPPSPPKSSLRGAHAGRTRSLQLAVGGTLLLVCIAFFIMAMAHSRVEKYVGGGASSSAAAGAGGSGNEEIDDPDDPPHHVLAQVFDPKAALRASLQKHQGGSSSSSGRPIVTSSNKTSGSNSTAKDRQVNGTASNHSVALTTSIATAGSSSLKPAAVNAHPNPTTAAPPPRFALPELREAERAARKRAEKAVDGLVGKLPKDNTDRLLQKALIEQLVRNDMDESIFKKLFDRLNDVERAAKNCQQKPTRAPPTPPPTIKPSPNCSEWDEFDPRIPRVIHVVWKTEALFHDSATVDAEWRENEPCFARRVVTDAECRVLAGRVPGLQPWYDRLPLNVMRADTCRVLAVYFYGGIYMDLDVKWTRPMIEWFNVSSDIVLGWEVNNQVVCNWFFAAEPMHPCMWAVITNITSRISRNFTRSDFLEHPSLVHHCTGPAVFSESLVSCATPTLTRADMTKASILHLYGSQLWKDSTSYSSWVIERMAMAGWKSPFGHGSLPPSQRHYLEMPYAELIDAAPLDGPLGGPRLVVTAVRQSSYRFPALDMICGPERAIDNNLETYSQTVRSPPSSEQQWWEIAFSNDLALPDSRLLLANSTLDDGNETTAAATTAPPTQHQPTRDPSSNETMVYCINLLNRRDSDFGHFDNFTLDFVLANGTTSLSLVMKVLSAGFLQVDLRTLANGSSFRTFRVVRWGEVSLAEVQIFTDPECRKYRRLHLAHGAVPAPPMPLTRANTTWAKLTHRMYAMMMTRTHLCDAVHMLGEKVDSDSQWPTCGLEFVAQGPMLTDGAEDEEDDATRTATAAIASHGGSETNSSSPLPPTASPRRRRPVALLVQMTLYSVMEQDLAEMGYEVHTFDGSFQVPTEEVVTAYGNYTRHKHTLYAAGFTNKPATQITFEQFLAEVVKRGDRISLLKLNAAGREWGLIDNITNLAERGHIDQLLIEMHTCGTRYPWNANTTFGFVASMEKLLKVFYVVGARFSEFSSTVSEPFAGPCCVKISMLRKEFADRRAEQLQEQQQPQRISAVATPAAAAATNTAQHPEPQQSSAATGASQLDAHFLEHVTSTDHGASSGTTPLGSGGEDAVKSMERGASPPAPPKHG